MEVRVLKADITTLNVDAIVNAANSSLLGGGGVDGAIHRQGGPEILEACRAIRNRQGQCNTGEAVITTAGNLPARHVIHTVGPVWNGGDNQEPHLLANCYRSSLRLCVEHSIRSVAFPNISTGIYGYPKEKAAETALATVETFDHGGLIRALLFVCFDDENLRIYQGLMPGGSTQAS